MYNSCQTCNNNPYQYYRDCMFDCPVIKNLYNENMNPNCNQFQVPNRSYPRDYIDESYIDYYTDCSYSNEVKMRKVSIEEIRD